MTTKAAKLAPSILAADFAHLGDQIAEAERAGADRIHIDVMDGLFVQRLKAVALRLTVKRPDYYGILSTLSRQKLIAVLD